MKIFRVLLIAILLVIINACGDKGTATGIAPNPNAVNVVDGPMMPINTHKDGEYMSLEDIRRQAAALIAHRVKTNSNAISMITAPYWTWGGFYDGKTMIHPKNFTGQWLKFEDDFTYTYGYYDNINGTGTYYYRLDDMNLVMLDDKEDLQPKEFVLQSNGTSIAIVGRHGFQINNGMQMKLDPQDARPAK